MTLTDNAEKLFSIGLSLTKGFNARLLRCMKSHGMTAEEFMCRDTYELVRMLGVNEKSVPNGTVRAQAMARAADELKFVNNAGIKVLVLDEERYPDRLAQCFDAPPVLYVLGDADLDAKNILSIVGTRRATAKGSDFVGDIVKHLAIDGMYPLIVSGLAYGIDTSAHEAALANGLPTVAVVAHGLDSIYPPSNRMLARNIVKEGGAVVTEYPSHTQPYRPRFLERNRIVAGLADVVLVIESQIKGGAMATARVAADYNRLVCALPGRYDDDMSEGCNHLIYKNIASLITSARQLEEAAMWKPVKIPEEVMTQQVIFDELTDDCKRIYEIIRKTDGPMPLQDIIQATGLAVPDLFSLLGELEFEGMINKLPGNKYQAKKLQ